MTDTNKTPDTMESIKTTDTTSTTSTSDYTPVFSAKVRTGVYIACLFAAIVGAALSIFIPDPRIGAFVLAASALVASSFGVKYNPLSLGIK